MMDDHENHEMTHTEGKTIFARVISILEQARGNVVRAVNSNMVLVYWLIGREIVQEVQGGEERAEYGKQVVENLSARLTEKLGRASLRQPYGVSGSFIRCTLTA